jgi:hypothetical protein
MGRVARSRPPGAPPEFALQRESTARAGCSVAELDGAAGAALDLHEGITTPRCDRWPEALRLRSTLGELVRGRCHATNLCLYCAKLAAVENSELLALDALQGLAPRVWLCLTTPSDSIDPADFYRAREKLVLALRRRWPHLEWAALVEFTTGYGSGSGGLRRPHWNVLLKGVGPDELAELTAIVARVWCPRVAGDPRAQHVGLVAEFGGLMRYIALHFQKQEQAPPAGWRGHRFLKSRGYLWTGTEEARQLAREALRLKREVWKLEQLGLDGLTALDVAQARVDAASELAWELVRLQPLPTSFGPDGLPSTWTTEVVAV